MACTAASTTAVARAFTSFPYASAPEPLLRHEPLQPQERVPGAPGCHLLGRTVAGGVIGGGVVGHAVGQAFDEGRPFPAARLGQRFPRCPVDGEDVVAVHLYPLEAIGDRPSAPGEPAAVCAFRGTEIAH